MTACFPVLSSFPGAILCSYHSPLNNCFSYYNTTNIRSFQPSRAPGVLIVVAENFLWNWNIWSPNVVIPTFYWYWFLWWPSVNRVAVDSGCLYMQLCCSRWLEMYLSIEHDLHVCCTEYISITNFKFRWFLESWHTTVIFQLMYHHLLCKMVLHLKLRYDRYKGLAILSVLKLVWVRCSCLILLLAVNIFIKITLLLFSFFLWTWRTLLQSVL
jgi:hypothetical protein